MIEDSLMDLETKIQNVCKTVSEPYYPIENELCLSKYCKQYIDLFSIEFEI